MQRKPTTVQDYRIIIRRHLVPFFSPRALDRITEEHVASYVTCKLHEGLAPKTVSNHLAVLHAVFGFAVKRGLATDNPVERVDRPRQRAVDPDVRFLAREELEALLRAVPSDDFGRTDYALFLTAAMTGLRQGELLALRWQDVDWPGGVIRVRRSYTRGRFGTPKSRRSSRAVPMADRVAGELHRHFARSPFRADEDLVFAHPQLGSVLDASRLRLRFKAAQRGAGLRPLRFHDLRHTYGTQMAAAGAPLRMLQEWMGHRDYKTTAIYADYSPDISQGAAFAQSAFGTEDDRPVGNGRRHESPSHAAEIVVRRLSDQLELDV
jgi:integrase